MRYLQLPIPSPKPPPDICPICGDHITIDGRTTHGNLIGSCGDSFSQESWEEYEESTVLYPHLIEICF
jgi:hypothetical protein